MLWYCLIKHLMTSLQTSCFYSLSVFKTTGQTNISTKYLSSVRLIYNVAIFYEEVETANKPTDRNESHYKMHFGSRCLLLSDYLIVVCVLSELAILISRLLPATRGACNPNLQVATTHTQYVCSQLCLDFH